MLITRPQSKRPPIKTDHTASIPPTMPSFKSILASTMLIASTTASLTTAPTPLPRALTMNEMFTELDDIANIMNDEFKQRREASLTREKDCHHRGVALRVDEGGVREQANATRTALVRVNVETREILQDQNKLSMLTNTLTTKITNVGHELRDTENDIVDAERLSEGNANTYQSHMEKHAKNVAIVDELIGYLQKSTPGGDVLTTTTLIKGRKQSLRAPTPTETTSDSALLDLANDDDGSDGAAVGTIKNTHEPIKLTTLLNDIKQSMVDFAPQRDMSHKQLKSSHNQLIATLDAKLTRLETVLQGLQSEKITTSNGLSTSIVKMKQVTSKTDILEKSLAKEKIHLTSIQSHIHHHEKMCDMMEIKFNELRTLMMDDLGMIKTIKNMLGKHTLERVQMVATHLAEDLEQPPTSVVV